MNKIALSLLVLAGLSTASFASQRNLDPDFVYGKKDAFNTTYGVESSTNNSVQFGAVISGTTSNSAWAKILENMKRQESNR